MKKRCCKLKKKKDEALEKYILEINEKNEKVIKKVNLETKQEINIIFDTSESTDVMNEIIKQLTKYYMEDILKIQM